MRKNAIGCNTAPWRREDVIYVDRLENMSKWSAGKQRSVTACSTVENRCRYVTPASQSHITVKSEASSLDGDF